LEFKIHITEVLGYEDPHRTKKAWNLTCFHWLDLQINLKG